MTRKLYSHTLPTDLMDELDRRVKKNNAVLREVAPLAGDALLSRSRIVEYALREFLASPDGAALLPE